MTGDKILAIADEVFMRLTQERQMIEHNVASMPEDWWMWTGDGLVPLGICEDFNEAADKAEQKPRNHVWIFSRGGLEMLRAQINEELGHNTK